MKKIIIVSIIIALVFFVFGYVVGSGKLAKSENTFQAGWQAAKQRLAESELVPTLNDNIEIKNISGKVQAINGNDITLTIRPLEPLADPALDERIITVDGNTKIYIMEQKDQETFQKEMEDFQKNIITLAETPIVPPAPYNKKTGSLADIKVGATLNITAQDKDIKNVKKFTAAEISF